MAYKVIILYRLYMPSYFLGTFTEYPDDDGNKNGTLLSFEKRESRFFDGDMNEIIPAILLLWQKLLYLQPDQPVL